MERYKYGKCGKCGFELAPVWFQMEELTKNGYPTGRVKNAVDYLVCECCGEKYAVDDTFDGGWYRG